MLLNESAEGGWLFNRTTNSFPPILALPDGMIRLWPREGTGEAVVLSPGNVVLSLAVLANGRLASGGFDGQIKLWENAGSGEPMVLSHGSSVLSLAVLTDGPLKLTGTDEATG